ncbi:MAG TPA: MBOAT family O-acyltransferase [Candidatus Paceibacterota bacterium]|nr:MBOAT family O-acyltransferase [Candidatus Paceibacterota bacterium]
MFFVPKFIFILAFTITLDYFLGILIEESAPERRRLYLILSIISNISILFVFKYFNFFNANVAAVAHYLDWNYSFGALSLILPIGLSFHTFQSLSYVIEVYRKTQKAERHFGIFALYVMFYPQLVAGPIERPQNMLHQFHEQKYFELQRVLLGLQRMMYGFFKKIVIADNIVPFVTEVYGSPHGFPGISLMIATVLFAVQIYCDFSGYGDIAIGAAKVMGFDLMENFRQPYFSASVAEFWKRWHISLSTWFKDYVYIPLGGSRVSAFRRVFNFMVTFLLSGLWHGANWTYVIWGGLNGAALSAGSFFKGSFSGVFHIFRVVRTFIFICVTWIFFRAESMSDAWYILTHLFSGWNKVFAQFHDASFRESTIFLGQNPARFFALLAFIATFFFIEYLIEKKARIIALMSEHTRRAYFLRWFVMATIVLLIVLFVRTDKSPFIYFQF